MKEPYICIYEYKDDDTPMGATVFEGFAKDMEEIEEMKLPHLHPDWHYRVQMEMREYVEE